MSPNRGSLIDKPFSLVVDRAAKQLSIERVLAHRAAALANANGTQRTRVVLNFPTKTHEITVPKIGVRPPNPQPLHKGFIF